MPGPDVRLFVLADEQRETGRDIRPVFESPEHYMFGTRQVVFSVTRNIFRNAKQLARKGEESSSEVVAFYRAPHVPRPDFNRRRVSGTLRSKMGALEGIIASYEQKKRSSLWKSAPTKGYMFRFSDENHTGFLTVIMRYDEHSKACSITKRSLDTAIYIHKISPKTMVDATQSRNVRLITTVFLRNIRAVSRTTQHSCRATN